MHKIAVLALWISILFSGVIAFQVVVTLDEAQPVGTRDFFTVVEVTSASKEAALTAIDSAAKDLGINIFKVQPDPHNTFQDRILFAFIGDSKEFTDSGGYDYPTFSQGAATRVLPASDITTEDLRGRYSTNASARELDQLLTVLDEHGIDTTVEPFGPLVVLLYSFGQGNLAALFIMMVLALGLALAYSVAHHRKVYALRELHGYRAVFSIRTDLEALTLAFGAGLLLLAVISIPILGFYNDFRQVGRFIRVLAYTVSALYGAAATVLVVSAVSTRRANIPSIVKGERATIRNGVLAAITQVAVFAIVIATTSAAMTRIDAVGAAVSDLDRWTDAGPLYALRLSWTGTNEDDLRNGPGFAAVIASMEDADQVLFVGYKADVTDGTRPTYEPNGLRSLIVNNTYLDQQIVMGADGERVTDLPGEKDRFTLLVPESYDGDPGALLDTYVDYFRTFACPEWGEHESESDACHPEGTVIRTQSNQRLFIYNGTRFFPIDMQGSMFIDDPVIAVVQASSGLIASWEYFGYTTSDDVLFTDAQTLERNLKEQGIEGSFQGIDNAADAVTASMAIAQGQLRMDAFSLVLGWVVLVLSSLVMVAVYCDRRKRPMFVEFIHGYNFVRRHWLYLVGIVFLALLGVGVAAPSGAISHGRDIVTVAGFIAVQVAVAVIAITVYETRFRSDFIKRY